jgi:hypothetical protein
MRCGMCVTGKLKLNNRGQLVCNRCTRYVCKDCKRVILDTESWETKGNGHHHAHGCPGICVGEKYVVVSKHEIGMEMVNPGMR